MKRSMKRKKQKSKLVWLKWVVILMALVTVALNVDGTNIDALQFIGLSTHYQRYHDAFEQVKTFKAVSELMCLGQVGKQSDGTQEDGRVAFIYDCETKDCRVGKVPFQLVKVVQELYNMYGQHHFVNNNSKQNLFIGLKPLQDFTKIALIGANLAGVANQVIDLASTTSTCAHLPTSPLDPWNSIIALVTVQGRSFGHGLHRDFNDFWIFGGTTNLGSGPQVTITENFKDGSIDLSGQVNAFPARLADLNRGYCHVQLDMKTQFFAGGTFVNGTKSRVVGLWNWDTNQWTELPSLSEGKHLPACGFFRNNNGQIEVVVGGGLSGSSQSSVVEIYNPRTLAKRTGPPLPFDHYATATAQLSNHFIVAGGFRLPNGGERPPKLYTFNPETETFVLLPQTMAGRDNYVAISISDSLTSCT